MRKYRQISFVKNHPDKANVGSHMFVTEAETLEQALEVIKKRRASERRRQTNIAKKPKLSLSQQFGMLKGGLRLKPITLSDRVVPGVRLRPPSTAKPSVRWSKEQVIAAHATGSFKVVDLMRRAGVCKHQILLWCGVTEPVMWDCRFCKTKACRGPTCRSCGKRWDHGLDGAAE